MLLVWPVRRGDVVLDVINVLIVREIKGMNSNIVEEKMASFFFFVWISVKLFLLVYFVFILVFDGFLK